MSNQFGVHIDGDKSASRALHNAPLVLVARVHGTTAKHGRLLQTRVRANASGRTGVTYTPTDGGPSGEIGPSFQSGDYRRSIGLQTGGGTTDPYAEVGSSAPQARRLEFGFVGRDSLGRHYDQPPYPHFRPALDEVAPKYAQAIEADYDHVDRLIGSAR